MRKNLKVPYSATKQFFRDYQLLPVGVELYLCTVSPIHEASTFSLPVLIRSACMTASMIAAKAEADCISSGSGGGALTGGKNFMATPC